MVPLQVAVEVVSRTQRHQGVPRGSEAALQVIAMALRGAALPDIKGSLPQILSLAVSSSSKVQPANVPRRGGLGVRLWR